MQMIAQQLIAKIEPALMGQVLAPAQELGKGGDSGVDEVSSATELVSLLSTLSEEQLESISEDNPLDISSEDTCNSITNS